MGSGWWTGDAASQDETGLLAVGAIMLAFGPAAGTSVAAVSGAGVRPAIDPGELERRLLVRPQVG